MSEFLDQLIYLAQGEVGPESTLVLGKSGIKAPRSVIGRFCRANKIEKLMLFGSALTDSFNHDSDIDLLVSFAPGCKPSLIQQSAMERELGDILGRKVELRTSDDLSRYFRKEVLNYAQGLFPDGQ